MSPFCTKLFNWGKNKKENVPSNVPSEPIDEGESCPYWTHVPCRPSTPTYVRTPTQPPPLPPHHPGSPVHTQPVGVGRSPMSHRRVYAHSYTNSPCQSPLGTLRQSPLGTLSQSHLGTLSQSPLGTLRQSPLGTLRQSPLPPLSPVMSHCTPTGQSPIVSPHQSPRHHSLQQSHQLYHASLQHSLQRRGYMLEGNYSQPLPPPPPLRPPPPLPGQEGAQLKATVASTSSSRSTSPANGNGSFIPTSRSHGARGSLNEKHSKTGGSLIRSSLRGPPTAHSAQANQNSPYNSPLPMAKQKDSMLDKFKLFNHKDKEAKNKQQQTNASAVSKRTSSSSGFSSARSERSDSSISVCSSDAKPPPLPPHQSLPVSTSSSSSDQTFLEPPIVHVNKSPGLRGIRSKFTRNKDGKESPKVSRKDKEKEGRNSPRMAPRSSSNDSTKEENSGGWERGKRGETPKAGEMESNEGIYVRGEIVPCREDVPPALPRKESSLGFARVVTPTPTLPQVPTVPPQLSSTCPGSPVLTPGTGIPKPTAHVKGTAKVVPPERTSSTPQSPGGGQKEYHKGVHRSPKHSSSIPDNFPEIRDPKGSLPRQKQLSRRGEEMFAPISVALVSPMPIPRDLVPHSESSSNVSDSSHSNSNSSGGNSSSGNSSVIYKPTSSEDGSNADLKLPHQVIVEEKPESEEGDDLLLNIKPMQPLARAAQYGYMRGLGLQSNRTLPPTVVQVSRLAMQDNSNTVPQKGMRVLQNLKRPSGPSQLSDADYSDLENTDLTNGYMSDGDVLRVAGYRPGTNGDLDGYLSEGGASLYAQKLNLRFKEGMRQVHESINKAQHFMQDDSATNLVDSQHNPRLGVNVIAAQQEDSRNNNWGPLGLDNNLTRFDDSSSLSSGVSDTLNELAQDDLTSSPYHDPFYGKTSRGMKEVGLKLPVGLSGSTPRKAAMGMDPSGMYKVVSSRAHVKKTESAQQTENGAFKQISNTQWKKFVESGTGNLDITPHDAVVSSRGSDKRSILDSPQAPNGPCLNGQGVMPPSMSVSKRGEKKLSIEKKSSERGRERGNGAVLNVNGDARKVPNPKVIQASVTSGGRRTPTGTGGSSSAKVSRSSSREGGENASECQSLERVQIGRTKLKVSGGTQTTSDLQYMPLSSCSGVQSDGEYSRNSLGRKYPQVKSHSLNGPVAAQLSQSLRDRIMQSSTYGKTHFGAEVNPYASPFLRERSPRLRPTDGSLSDSPYSNYAELQYATSPYTSPYTWMPSRGNYAASVASAPTRPVGGSLTEAESLESVISSASSIAAQIQHARASGLTQARLFLHQREAAVQLPISPRLARSNSVSHLIERTYPRSTKSEKLYSVPSVWTRDGPINLSQPTSPTLAPGSAHLPVSPLNTLRGSPYYTSSVPRISKDDDCHGSALSLVSSSSSLYGSQEEKQAAEVRKLRKDLGEAKDRVGALTNQLTTNAHVVAAFEQSLTNMTNRLQQLMATSEKKDSELIELRRTIEALRQQSASASAGLSMARLQSMSSVTSPRTSHPASPCKRVSSNPHSNVSCSVLTVPPSPSPGSVPEGAELDPRPGLDVARRHTFNGNCRELVVREMNDAATNLVRGPSMESMSSLSSACSGVSLTSGQDRGDLKNGKKKGWLRSSFTKAFSRGGPKKGKTNSVGGSVSDMEGGERGDCSVPSSPLFVRANSEGCGSVNGGEADTWNETVAPVEEVLKLRHELQEKDMVLTDLRLEALSSTHQLESLKEVLGRMRSEMMSLKHDNDRLQMMVSPRRESGGSDGRLCTSPDGRHLFGSEERHAESEGRLSRQELYAEGVTECPMIGGEVVFIDPCDKEGKRVSLVVCLGCHMRDTIADDEFRVTIGAVSVSGRTKWEPLDALVRRIFKEYLLRVDPTACLGLSADSVTSYSVGEVTRSQGTDFPELLPCGYLVGDVTDIRLVLKGAATGCVDCLAFETLVPKAIMQRYVALLTEHRRIILCGPPGTGKTYLAKKLADFLVARSGRDPSTPGHVASFSVDRKSCQDLGAYLSNVSEQCGQDITELPQVIILDNLHHAGSLTEVFNGCLSAKYNQCPFIIGTMNQTSSCSATNLQLHHNFRWVLMTNQMEPTKGLVGRISRRKLTEAEVARCKRLPQLQQVLDWLPRCWQHINKFLETHSSSDVTIGPRLFLSCPVCVDESQVWFSDLWNYSLVPYLVEAVRDGLTLYGRRATWEDPSTWITETYPWPPGGRPGVSALLSLRPDDVGFDTTAVVPLSASSTNGNTSPEKSSENDPLLSMLMRLQEAANYSNPLQLHETNMESKNVANMETALESML